MIKLPSYLTGFSSKSDGSAGIRFSTQELSADDFSELKKNLNEYGWLVFRPNDFKEEDIPTEDAEDTEKTPSKRLRAVLFVLWKQNGGKGDFENFYREQVEKVIEHIKTKLD